MAVSRMIVGSIPGTFGWVNNYLYIYKHNITWTNVFMTIFAQKNVLH